MKILSTLRYWEERVKIYGRRAVISLGHPEQEFEAVTQKQKEELYPPFLASLEGGEKTLLDFGCGAGRFTADLANLMGGKAIGMDPVDSLIRMAAPAPHVEYLVFRGLDIPLRDESVDIVWVCLVLGGIDEEDLVPTAGQITRVLKKGGLVFLVENTSSQPNKDHWAYRSVHDYLRLFPSISLAKTHSYEDLGQTMSILAGRKAKGKSLDSCATYLCGGQLV